MRIPSIYTIYRKLNVVEELHHKSPWATTSCWPILPHTRRRWSMNVLVAGGAGYIGSHTVKRLKEAGHSPIIYDNISRGHREVIEILDVPATIADLNDREALLGALREYRIDT